MNDEHVCQYCASTFTRPPHRGRVHKYCSRSCAGAAVNGRKDTCAQGHQFTPENTIRLKDRRRCRTCHQTVQRRRTSTEKYRERRRSKYPLSTRKYSPSTRDRDAKRVRSANAQSRSRAHRHGYEWTGPELEVAGRTDLTAKQAATILGRTIAAVNTARAKLKDHPREINLAGLAQHPDTP